MLRSVTPATLRSWRRHRSKPGGVLIVWLLLAACASDPAPTEVDAACGRMAADTPPSLPAGAPCEKLSSYGLFTLNAEGVPEPAAGVVAYDLNTPLFSDYALKDRMIFVPAGASAPFTDSGTFDFPVGTVIAKTFSYPADMRAPNTNRRVVETRLLARKEDGWHAWPYIWNESQTDAVYTPIGGTFSLSWVHTDGSTKTANYLVPNENQCAECHGNDDPNTERKEKRIGLIGPKAMHLNRNYPYPEGSTNQLTKLAEVGFLTGVPTNPAADAPALAAFDDMAAPLTDRARAYLDINCAHCHNPRGTGAGSGLMTGADVTDLRQLGVCKVPIRGVDASRPAEFDIAPGNPEGSAVYVRMDNDSDPEIMMPRIGRSLIHSEGVALIGAWIESLDIDCSNFPEASSTP